MVMHSKLIYKFNENSIKTLAGCFYRNSPGLKIEFVLKFVWKFKGPGIAKTNLKKNKIGGLTLPHFKTYYTLTKRRCRTGIRIDVQINEQN